jgi:hypothetical protein
MSDAGAAYFNSWIYTANGGIGRDAHNVIDFSTDDVVHYKVGNSILYRMDVNGLRPYTDSAVDLGGASYYWKDAYIDTITTTGKIQCGGELEGTSLDINGAADIAGNLTLTGDIAATGDTFTFESANADDPAFVIKNTANDNQAARLRLLKARTNTALNNDRVSEVDFVGENDAGTTKQYGKILVQALEVDAGAERGKMRLQVAEYDSTLTDGLVLDGSTTNGEVDVTIGNGAASVTTIAGALAVTGSVSTTSIDTNDGDITTGNGNIECNDLDVSGNITGDGTSIDNVAAVTAVSLTSGNKTIAGVLDITDTTDASDATGDTGALRTEGGASIAKKLYAGSTITGSADVIAYSDKKLKENIKTLDGKKVLEMRGVSFDRVDTGKASSGVIAQEMEKVAPELVIDDGNYKGVAYGNVVGYLIEAIKDQQKQIDELKTMCNGCSR